MRMLYSTGKILKINPAPLKELIQGSPEFIELLSGEILVINEDQDPDFWYLNDFASTLAKRAIFGPAVLADSEELEYASCSVRP